MEKQEKGFYTAAIVEKFGDALNDAWDAIQAADAVSVKISNSNSKMGAVSSVSTLPFITCPAICAGTCGPNCYAAKLANLRPSVLKAYAWNTALAIHCPDIYWTGIDAACKGVRFFRFHVSGDIMNAEYFENMVKVARNNPHCEILAFTKRYNVVNAWIENNGDLPENMHVLFSGWTNLQAVNPHNLPETNVFDKAHEPQENWKICGGNCYNCACRGVGCWAAEKGDVIAFKMH